MKMRSIPRWAAILLAPLSACGGASQYTAPPAAVLIPIEALPYDPEKQSFTETIGIPEYVLGYGDVLEVTLRGLEQVKEEIPVRSDGMVSFSMVQNVRAAGLTLRELDEELTRELKKYLREPSIDVDVSEYKSKMVSLQGAILSISTLGGGKTGPGRYPLKGKVRMLDLILEAGGTTPDAQLDRVQLIRGDKSYRLNIQRVLNTGDARDNVVLQADDILVVPGIARQSKKVIILGEVNSPNVFVFPEDVTLLEALGQAGGLKETAIRNDIRIIRNVEGAPQMFSLNYEQMVNGHALDKNIHLESNDIIYAPRSFIGDINETIAKITPLLDILLVPANYRDVYTTGSGLRLETGPAPTGTPSTILTRQAGKPAVPADSTAQGK
ncbi:MAG: SLBB domain-containing protein [Candidatus Latescibacteria bacterium]|nr:SLBB domain-containing protein [Candidatus Latescibacterota bacterium]